MPPPGPPPGRPEGWSPPPGRPPPASFPPPGDRPPGGGQGKGPLFAALAGVALLVVLAVVAVATIPDSAGNPLVQPPPSASVIAPPATPPATTPETTTPETTTPAEGIGSIDIAAGECADFSVTTENEAEVELVDCDAAEASHVVVDQVTDPAECPGDVDLTYYETSFESETLALCMDVNWKIGTCYDITYGPGRTEQVGCSGQPDRRIEQVETVLRDTTAYEGCSRGGFAYNERRFVVCTAPVR